MVTLKFGNVYTTEVFFFFFSHLQANLLILKQINKLKQNLIIGNILSYNIRRLCVHSLVVHQTLNCAAFAVFRLHCWFGFFLPFILAHFSKSDSAGVFMGSGT